MTESDAAHRSPEVDGLNNNAMVYDWQRCALERHWPHGAAVCVSVVSYLDFRVRIGPGGAFVRARGKCPVKTGKMVIPGDLCIPVILGYTISRFAEILSRSPGHRRLALDE